MLPHPASVGALKPRIIFLEKIAMLVQHVPEPVKRLLIAIPRQKLRLPGIPGGGRPLLFRVVDYRGFRTDVTGKCRARRDPAAVINNNDFPARRECSPRRAHSSDKASRPVLCRYDYRNRQTHPPLSALTAAGTR